MSLLRIVYREDIRLVSRYSWMRVPCIQSSLSTDDDVFFVLCASGPSQAFRLPLPSKLSDSSFFFSSASFFSASHFLSLFLKDACHPFLCRNESGHVIERALSLSLPVTNRQVKTKRGMRQPLLFPSDAFLRSSSFPQRHAPRAPPTCNRFPQFPTRTCSPSLPKATAKQRAGPERERARRDVLLPLLLGRHPTTLTPSSITATHFCASRPPCSLTLSNDLRKRRQEFSSLTHTLSLLHSLSNIRKKIMATVRNDTRLMSMTLAFERKNESARKATNRGASRGFLLCSQRPTPSLKRESRASRSAPYSRSLDLRERSTRALVCMCVCVRVSVFRRIQMAHSQKNVLSAPPRANRFHRRKPLVEHGQ